MIISASYKTDIPTFYGEWFLKRLNAGFCKMVNPYSRKVTTVSLSREDVDGFVFWTKNLGPFLGKLESIYKRGFPFIVQYTINAYPRLLESSVVNWEHSVNHMKYISSVYGKRVAIWRYDPIIISSSTSSKTHIDNFEQLARGLEGTTDEVVVSFAQLYKKTLKNMKEVSQKHHWQWEDPSDEFKLQMLFDLAGIAKLYGMQLTVCSQARFVIPGVKPARCVDAFRLSGITGRHLPVELKANRPDCGCYASKDIGDYDTCPHGCIYCYAVMNRDLALERYKQHNPDGEFLFEPDGNTFEERDIPQPDKSAQTIQSKLF